MEILWYTNPAANFQHWPQTKPIKGDGGANWIDRGCISPQKVDGAGPEVSHLVAEYEAASGAKDATVNSNHHEQTMKAQQVFLEKADKLTRVLQDFGNPFKEESRYLLETQRISPNRVLLN